ncbi:MAG: cytochrome-c peroxidase [Acidithiobacillus sp.]
MNRLLFGTAVMAMTMAYGISAANASPPPLGLPPVPIPADNPQTPAKIALGDKLFHDARFSSTGTISCASCHADAKAFTDHLPVAEGVHKLKGTRNTPTIINAAYFHLLFWDGREPSLEAQAKDPMVNPVEMGLKNHEPVLKIVRTDPAYQAMFKQVFGVTGNQVTMQQVLMAIGSFERTVVSGDSPFDRYVYGGDKKAMSPAAVAGMSLFQNKGRCVDCHTMNTTYATFMDNRFHNLGIGANELGTKKLQQLAMAFLANKEHRKNVDTSVLTNKDMSELGRFAVTGQLNDLGAFKTPTLRNVAVTGPYMHNGSLKSLMDVVNFYNNGGVVKKGEKANVFQSGGIRPLELTEKEKKELVAFLEALTSPQYVNDGPKSPVRSAASR